VEATDTFGVGFYLSKYVGDFLFKFTEAFPEVKVSDDLGESEYKIGIEHFRWIERFLELRGAVLQLAGTNLYAQDPMLIDEECRIVFVVNVIYNKISERLKFIPQSYARLLSNGVFLPSSSIDLLRQSYQSEETLNMVQELEG